ncbi:MAG: hypothetical protein PHS17_08425 [Desulfobacterales bacterium]|nr:hypothetical protein [Desulfobacterales bacterium]
MGSGGSRISRYASAILALFIPFVAYWLFPSAQFDGEGLIQAYRGEVPGLAGAGDIVFWNSTSLFGGLTSALMIRIWSFIGHPGNSLDALRFIYAFCGGLCALVLFWLLRTLNREDPVSLLVSLLFSFSSGFWLVSTNIRTYPVAVLIFLLNFCYLLLCRRARLRPMVLGIINSLGYFFHVTGIVFVPVTLASFILERKTLKKKAQNILYYLMSLAVTSGAIFYGIYMIIRKSISLTFPEFLGFEVSNYISRRLELENFGPYLSLYLQKGATFCSRLMSSIVIGDFTFHQIIYDFRFILIAFILMLAITARRLMVERFYEVALCLVWFLCSSAAFMFLDLPMHPFLFVATMPLFIVFGLSAGILKSMLKWKFIVAVGIGLLLVINFYANFSNQIYADSLTSNNVELTKVLYFKNDLLKKDCVVASGFSDTVYFLYFSRCEVIDVAGFMGWKPEPERYLKLVSEIRSRVSRQRVFLYSPRLLTSDYYSAANQFGWNIPLLIKYLRRNFSFEPYTTLTNDTRLIRLTAKPSQNGEGKKI